MKVLAIMGSPRKKGNTYKITKKLEEKMKQMGNVEFEYLFLKDVNLHPCTGCFACISKGGNICPINDDRTKIEDKIRDADGVILASPVYVMQITWLMKILIDRMAYYCHRPRFFNQKAIAISTTGGIGLKETLNYLELVASGWGFNFVHKLGIQTPPWPKTSKSYNKDEKKIQDTAKIFYKSLQSETLPNPNLMSYIGFKIIKELSERFKEYLPSDFQFYKKHENYYYDTKISVIKKFMGDIVLKIILFMMRDNFVKNRGN
jgi:multimeric flavodoxin WrbA